MGEPLAVPCALLLITGTWMPQWLQVCPGASIVILQFVEAPTLSPGSTLPSQGEWRIFFFFFKKGLSEDWCSTLLERERQSDSGTPSCISR